MKYLPITLLVGVILCDGAMVQACNVPVFRYALERWRPDPYRVTVFHRDPLSDAQSALLGSLEEGDVSANVVLNVVNVDDDQNEVDRKLFAAQTSPQLPWLVVQYPQSLRNDKTIWAGPLTGEMTTRTVASPLRTELIRRLAAGQTAVWLMLECGDAAKDAAVAKQLDAELKKLSETLELPELSSAPEDNLLSNAPLKVAFSVQRVPRGAAEQPLVDMLLHSEPDLREFSEPMVFPVFGRGRALLPLIGAGITADNIQDSAGFLVGACSCEVKELNPGFDLLLAADWDDVLFAEGPPAEVLVARTAVSSGKPELLAIPAGAPIVTPDASVDDEESALEFYYQPMGLRYVILIALALTVVVCWCVLAAFRALRH